MAKLRGNEAYPIYFGAEPEILRLAGDLRRNMTKAERILWNHLRNKQLDGYRFRRQHPVKDFVVDFFCYEAMLVVEVDGSVHSEHTQAERDIERTRLLNQLGIGVIRFANDEVESNINEVITRIKGEIEERKKT